MKDTWRAALMAALVPGLLAAQAPDSSANVNKPLFGWADLGWVAAVTGLTYAVSRADVTIQQRVQEPRYQDNATLASIADKAQYFNERSEFAGAIVFWGVGKLAHSKPIARTSLHIGEAVFAVSAATTVIRGVLGRSRPFVTNDSDQYDFHYGKGFGQLKYRAFPSIHAAASYATATVLATDITRAHPGARWIVGPLLYGAAALPGLGRVYADKHWTSDVFAGTAAGIYTGIKIEHFTHDHPGNWFDRKMVGLQVAPTDGGIGFAWSGSF